MTKSEFCWWLHGFMEIGKPEALAEVHVKEIKNHLALILIEAKPISKNPSWIPQPSPNIPYCSSNTDILKGSGFDWYPESLRKYNLEHPENPIGC